MNCIDHLPSLDGVPPESQIYWNGLTNRYILYTVMKERLGMQNWVKRKLILWTESTPRGERLAPLNFWKQVLLRAQAGNR